MKHETNCLIDYLTFTIPVQPMDREVTQYEVLERWREEINDSFYPVAADVWDCLGGLTPRKGRPPYLYGWSFEGGLLCGHPAFNHFLFEFTGQGCDILRQYDLLKWMIRKHRERLTRLDFAVDIKTPVKPSEIVKSGLSGRFKAISHIVSGTGETVYVGSPKSERYLRIYRYNDPHPRHEFLRFEFVFRKRMARDIGKALEGSQFDLRGLMAYCGIQWSIEHEVWDVRSPQIKVIPDRPEKQKAGTLLWLTGTCAPAFRKAVREGIITSPDEFIKEYFLNEPRQTK